ITPTSTLPFLLLTSLPPPHLHSFPTRRSSDLLRQSDLPARRHRVGRRVDDRLGHFHRLRGDLPRSARPRPAAGRLGRRPTRWRRSEEHTSELQSPYDLVCRLLLEKKKKRSYTK